MENMAVQARVCVRVLVRTRTHTRTAHGLKRGSIIPWHTVAGEGNVR